jgi:hypothetical protein
MWARRGVLAVVLVGAAVIPGRASNQAAPHCARPHCKTAGSIMWTTQLAGSWLAVNGVAGTVPASGEAYAASAGVEAVLAYGTTVTGYRASTGRFSWQTILSGIPLGSAVTSVRAWPAIVAVGVSVPAGQPGPSREEIILSAATGRQLGIFPAAAYGGAVRADANSTVIIGPRSVTSYANANGRVVWKQATGVVSQAWVVSGGYLYMAQTRGGYLSPGPVTGLRVINLISGAEQFIRPERNAFAGSLAGVVGDVALFSGSDGLWGYSTQGRLLWHRPSAVLDLIDPDRQTVYIATGDALTAVSVVTGATEGRPAPSVSAGLYAVQDGVALGLDQNNFGDAWGYDVATRQVIWTSGALPWPHFFADPTGLGGSAGSARAVTLVTSCSQTGSSPGNAAPAPCLRPELDAIRY